MSLVSYYYQPTYFATLSGYQAAADPDRTSDAAFDQDMGYVLIPEENRAFAEGWAYWAAAPDNLVSGAPFLVAGYAAESFTGENLATVQTAAPYFLHLAPAFYETRDYYSEEGMSGGSDLWPGERSPDPARHHRGGHVVSESGAQRHPRDHP